MIRITCLFCFVIFCFLPLSLVRRAYILQAFMQLHYASCLIIVFVSVLLVTRAHTNTLILSCISPLSFSSLQQLLIQFVSPTEWMCSATLNVVCGCVSLACTSIRSRIFDERWSFVLYVFVTLCLVFSYVLSHPIYSYFCLNTTITLERKSWPCLFCSLFGLLLCAYLLTYLLTCYFARIFTLLFRSTERPLSLLYSLIIDNKVTCCSTNIYTQLHRSFFYYIDWTPY